MFNENVDSCNEPESKKEIFDLKIHFTNDKEIVFYNLVDNDIEIKNGSLMVDFTEGGRRRNTYICGDNVNYIEKIFR